MVELNAFGYVPTIPTRKLKPKVIRLRTKAQMKAIKRATVWRQEWKRSTRVNPFHIQSQVIGKCGASKIFGEKFTIK